MRRDDDLATFEAHGAPALPSPATEGHVENAGARIWYVTYGSGAPVILLHGGLGHSGNWGYQAPELIEAGHRIVLIDSRGHGRSTHSRSKNGVASLAYDDRPFTYELMASDVLAVMDALGLVRAAIVGWSDGARTGLILAMKAPSRVAGVFFFGCNMDPSGTREITQPLDPVIARCFARHAKDYARLSATPGQFKAFVAAVNLMQKTEPNYTADELVSIRVPVAIVHAERDEFIHREHADYLVRSIGGAQLVLLPDVSHFAPLQRPSQFNRAVLEFLRSIPS